MSRIVHAVTGPNRASRPSRVTDLSNASIRLEKQLGQGYFSTAYLASGPWGKPVVIKVPNKGRATFETFAKEAEVLAKFDNSRRLPHLVAQILPSQSSVVPDGALVMEVVQGVPLKAMGGISEQRAIDLTVNFLEGDLSSLHQRHLVHRDIAPQNVLIDGQKMKLVDFGSADWVEKDTGRVSHGRGRQLGSPPYTDPEQRVNEQIDQSVDLYATAGLLFKMLTGQSPDPNVVAKLPEGRLKTVIDQFRATDASLRPSLSQAAAAVRSLNPNDLKAARTLRFATLYGHESEALQSLGENVGAHRNWANEVGLTTAANELRRKVDSVFFQPNASNRKTALATYYADFCLRANELGLNLGEYRNSPHHADHLNWAMSVPLAEVRNEVFARLEVIEKWAAP
ncbi:MAG: protein kinase [Myxococcaceae bacterium]|nr:protein kinase [Myxococcaceae bacterium]